MSQRIIPEYAMGDVPISGLPELETHLQQLVDDPTTPFNVKLLDDIELQLTGKPSDPLPSFQLLTSPSQRTTSLPSSPPSSPLSPPSSRPRPKIPRPSSP